LGGDVVPDDANASLIDRAGPASDAEQHLAPQLELLEQMVNYGSNVILRCFRDSDRKIEDIVILTVLFKQSLSSLDAISVLLKNGASLACHQHLRTLWEAGLYLDWILKQDSKKRSDAYWVANIRRIRSQHLRGTPGSPDHAAFLASLGDLAEDYLSPFTEEQAASEIEKANAILASDDFRDLNEHFEEFLKKRKFESSWHKPVGGQSVRGIACDLNRQAEYDIFYSLGSEMVHASSYGGHLGIDGSTVSMRGIRGLHEFSTVFSWSVTVMLRTIESVLTRYRPLEVPNFARKYVDEWRAPFRSAPNLSFEPTQSPLDPV
jgi:hypothetical protein